MSEEEYVEAPETSAQDESADLTPDTDVDTQDSSGSDTEIGTDEITTLKQELETLRNRVAHGTRTYQELQQERQARAAMEARISAWRQAGVDPDEIDRAIASVSGGQQQQAQQAPQGLSIQQLNQYLAQRDILRDWSLEKKAFFKEHKELDDPYFKRHMDVMAAEIANQEIQENGAIISSPEQVAAKAGKQLMLMINKLETKAQQKVKDASAKVKSQGVVDSSHARSRVPSDPDDNMDESSGQKYLRDLALGMHRSHRNKIMKRGIE